MCRGKHSSNSHIWGSVPFLSCAPIGVCAVDFYLAISHWVIVFHLLTWFLSWRQRQYLLCCLLCAPYLTHTRWTTNIYRGSDTINSPWICPYSAAASIPFQKHWKPSILFKPSPITRIIPLHIQWRTSGCHTHPSSVPYPFLSGNSLLYSLRRRCSICCSWPTPFPSPSIHSTLTSFRTVVTFLYLSLKSLLTPSSKPVNISIFSWKK